MRILFSRFLLLLLLPLTPIISRAQFNFTTNNGAITLTTYTGSGGDVIIPAATNGLPVTVLQSSVFSFNSTVTSVTIPDSITNIGWAPFLYCFGLTAINVDPNNPVYSSADGVLFDRDGTTLIEYPAGGPTNYVVPTAVLTVGEYAFDDCRRLVSITIPDSVTSLGEGAFYECFSLGSLVLPNSITNIADNAFYWCTNLTSIALPNAITKIGYAVFEDCQSLTNVTIPGSVSNIDKWAFVDCYSLVSVTIPIGITNIGVAAFGNCWSLLSVDIPTNITVIPDRAFSGCSSLTNVTIAETVTNIASLAFLGCTSLRAISVDALNSVYSSVDGVLFDKSQSVLLECPGGKAGDYVIANTVKRLGDFAFSSCAKLTGVTIPNSVTNLGIGVFEGCVNLTSMAIPDSVTRLEEQTFFGCASLTNVVIPNSVTSIGGDVFYGITNLASITIPGSVTEITGPAFEWSYGLTRVYFEGGAPALNPFYPNIFYGDASLVVYCLPGTAGWGATFGGSPTALWLPQPQTHDGSFGVQSNQFGFNINWASGQTIVVEAASNFFNPVWLPVWTNTLAGCQVYFSDPQWTNFSSRFYRLRTP